MGDHTYRSRKTGRVLPSVTTIIGDMSGESYSWWYASLRAKGIDPDWELDRLGKIGTICHYRVLSKLSPTPIEAPEFPVDEYPENSAMYADLFETMWRDLNIEVRRAVCEKKMVNEKVGFCGTFDCKGLVSGTIRDKKHGRDITFKNNKCLIDLKTSQEAREKHFIQLGGYSLFFDPVPEYGLVVCLCPYIEKNEYLLPKVYVLTQKELINYQRKFVKMAKDWWKQELA